MNVNEFVNIIARNTMSKHDDSVLDRLKNAFSIKNINNIADVLKCLADIRIGYEKYWPEEYSEEMDKLITVVEWHLDSDIEYPAELEKQVHELAGNIEKFVMKKLVGQIKLSDIINLLV